MNRKWRSCQASPGVVLYSDVALSCIVHWYPPHLFLFILRSLCSHIPLPTGPSGSKSYLLRFNKTQYFKPFGSLNDWCRHLLRSVWLAVLHRMWQARKSGSCSWITKKSCILQVFVCLFVLCLNTVQFSCIRKYLDSCIFFCNLAAVHGNTGFEIKQLEWECSKHHIAIYFKELVVAINAKLC